MKLLINSMTWENDVFIVNYSLFVCLPFLIGQMKFIDDTSTYKVKYYYGNMVLTIVIVDCLILWNCSVG